MAVQDGRCKAAIKQKKRKLHCQFKAKNKMTGQN